MAYSNPNVPTVNIMQQDPITGLVSFGTSVGLPPIVADIFDVSCLIQDINTTGMYENTGTPALPVWSVVTPGPVGTVTSVSVNAANGFIGTVSNPTSTPMITLETNQTGVLFGDGIAINGIADGLAGYQLTTDGAGTYSWQSPSSGGTVTSITAGVGLNGGVITTSGTIDLANTTVVSGAYTNANITIDAQGRITTAANGTTAGTVTSVSVVSANGFTGTVATATTTPAITLTTNQTGVLVGNGTSITGLADGTAGQQLTTNGAGVYSWQASSVGYTVVSSSTNPTTITQTTGTVFILLNTTASNITLNLPTAVANNAVYITKKQVAANSIIVTPAGGTIDGSATITMSIANLSVTLLSDGSNYYVT